ncbi:hypothetical protein KCP70_14485 [Salmonella enterica subsp. enterica]|nr:hypothetical protein KCP70_14485 [Salmonella enterica subsp. enterica]
MPNAVICRLLKPEAGKGAQFCTSAGTSAGLAKPVHWRRICWHREATSDYRCGDAIPISPPPSKWIFQNPDVRCLNINVDRFTMIFQAGWRTDAG